MSDADPRAQAKEEAGRHAAGYVTDGMRVGLGTGSTVHWTIVELGERALDIVCTATSVQTHDLALSLGLRVVSPDEIGHLDIAVDGADEVDPDVQPHQGRRCRPHPREDRGVDGRPLRRGGGRDRSWCRPLGPFGTPLEVLDFAPRVVISRLRDMGAAEVTTRPLRSDNGNLVMVAHFGTIAEPVALSAAAGGRPRPGRARHLPRLDGRTRRDRRRRRRPPNGSTGLRTRHTRARHRPGLSERGTGRERRRPPC